MASPTPGHERRPVLGVSVLVRKDGAVLLVQRGKEPFAGWWAFPGGHVEFGERLEDAAVREVREETNITIEGPTQIDTVQIISTDGGATSHYVLVVFEARYVGGTVLASDDAADAGWVAPSELAAYRLTETTGRVLARLAAPGGRR